MESAESVGQLQRYKRTSAFAFALCWHYRILSMETETEETDEEILNYNYSALFPNLLKSYDLVKEIGSGGQATVFRCRSKIEGKKEFACKIIWVGDTEPIKEVEIMQKLASSPGVVHIHEVIKDEGFWHLIMELCECSLLDVIVKKGRLWEKEAALLIRNLALAIQDLHQKGIIHRDLKPENVLVTSAAKPYDVRVSDFGLSARFSGPAPSFTSRAGTLRYFAPEVVQGYYSTEIDIWGLGLILYEALTGNYPFSSLQTAEIHEELLHCEDLAASHLHWPVGLVSEEAKSLVLAMLQPDPEERISVQQILAHPWVAKYYSSASRSAPQSLKRKRPCFKYGVRRGVPSKLIRTVRPCEMAC